VNFGCTRATFQSNDGCVNPIGGTTPVYDQDTNCPLVNPLPPGGNNDNCALRCSRCSANFGCTRANFQTYDNVCSDTSQPIGTVSYEQALDCPRLTTIPPGGNNNNCSAQSAPTIEYFRTAGDQLTEKTIASGNTVFLEWKVNVVGSVTCQASATPASSEWNSTKGLISSQELHPPRNQTDRIQNYIYTLTCSNGTNTSKSVKISVVQENSDTTDTGTQRNANFEQTSGMIFNGAGSILTNQNTGKVSERGWLLNAAAAGADDVVYKSPALNLSYEKLLANQDQTKVSFREITCTGNSCPAITESGVYHVTNGNPQSHEIYTFAAQSVPAGRRVVVLVNGGVNLTNTISTSNGGIFILAAKDKITVQKDLGSTIYACNAPANLQGIFTTQDNFEVEGTNDCTQRKDKMLIIDGNVITNADLRGNERFINNRDLCEDNLEFPAVSIRQRPDFIVNLPDFAKSQKLIFKELKP